MKTFMMECPPFSGQAACSDNQCPCPNTTMPPAKGYLWIKPEVADTRKNCLSLSALQSHMSSTSTSVMNIDEIRIRYLPLVICKEAAIRRKLDLVAAASDYSSWVKTGKVPCRATPIVANNPSTSGHIKQLAVTDKHTTNNNKQWWQFWK